MAVSRVVLLLVAAAAVLSSCCSASSVSNSSKPDIPVIVAVSGCPHTYRNWTIDCSAGRVLTLLLDNFQWIDGVYLFSKSSSSSYICGSVQPVNTSAVSCVLPYISTSDMGKILALYVHDQILDANSDTVLALEYNHTSQARAAADGSRLVAADPLRPVVLGASGCGRQFRNWTIDCSGGERLLLALTNFSYIDTVTFHSRHTGSSYYCGPVEDVDLEHVACAAPKIGPSDVGYLLEAVAHDSVSDMNSLPTFAIAYNKTGGVSVASASRTHRRSPALAARA